MEKRKIKTEEINGKICKVSILCGGLEFIFIPQIRIRKNKEQKVAKETNRIYHYGGELRKDKMKLDSLTEKKIRQQAWAIFFKQRKKKNTEKLIIPREKAILEEADLINKKVNLLKREKPSMTWTQLLEINLKKLATPITVRHSKLEYLSYFEKNLFFDLNKHGLKTTKEGWIIITRRKNKRSFKSVVFSIDSAIKMQDEILNYYLSSAANTCAEIPRIKELQEMVRKINNLLVDWSIGKKEKEKLKNKILVLIKELSLCRNQYKTDSKKLLESIVTLKDSLARENPGAFATKTVSVVRKLEKRLEEIEQISPIIENRKKILKKYQGLIHVEKMRAEKELIELIKISNFKHYSADGTNSIRINRILYTLDSLFLEQFSSRKNQTSFFLNAAKDCIMETKKAKKYLQTALAILQS